MKGEAVSFLCTTPEQAHAHALQCYRHALATLRNGETVLLQAGPALEPITLRQRKFLKDVVFGQIAEQVFVGEKRVRYTKQAWAELYRDRWLGHRWEVVRLPGKRPGRRKVRNSTEELGIRAYAAYTDRVIDDAIVELQVDFVFTREETELRAHHRKKDKPA